MSATAGMALAQQDVEADEVQFILAPKVVVQSV